MTGNFQACFQFTLGQEGGFANIKHDMGGPTKYGITLQTLSNWRGYGCVEEDIQDLELDEAQDIYQHLYWKPISGDNLPQRQALCTFDAAVNSGVKHAIQWLQSALQVFPDGIVGPVTIQIAQAHDTAEIVNDLLNIRLAYLKSLPDWQYFGKGWGNRISDLRCAAV